MEDLLQRSGFEVEARYGGFNNEPLTASSGELVWIARKQGPADAPD
jgi:hypothetical protein